jgi:thiamine kinase-like enzyme
VEEAFGNDHLPTFSHSDLQRKNIIVREIPSGDKNTSTEETYVVSIVDWEVAGWYPSYWEYAAAFFAFKWEDDWLERVEEVIDAWGAETAMIKMIYQDLWL